jgi:hypothetical protein
LGGAGRSSQRTQTTALGRPSDRVRQHRSFQKSLNRSGACAVLGGWSSGLRGGAPRAQRKSSQITERRKAVGADEFQPVHRQNICLRDETVDGGLEIDHAPEDSAV